MGQIKELFMSLKPDIEFSKLEKKLEKRLMKHRGHYVSATLYKGMIVRAEYMVDGVPLKFEELAALRPL